jgi:natural product precursor
MKKKKICLRGLSEILSEKELKNVLGGSASPCENNGCSGPHGTWVSGGLCCLLPCNGIFSTYGYGIVTGMSSCPW